MVKLEPQIDPSDMLDGMEEYLYVCKPQQFGEGKAPIDHLLIGMVNKDSMNHKIFTKKLIERQQAYIKEFGQDPADKEEAVKAQALQRKLAKEKELALAMKSKVYIPKYHFHTNSSVHKVVNCMNKSHQRRVRKKGLKAINEDDKVSKIRMDYDEK